MEKTIQNLKDNLRENLISISEYGKLEKQHLIVLDKLNTSILKEIKPLLQDYFKQVKKYPLLLTREELRDGLDVFPLEFLNMKLNHKILYGEDLFKELKFEKRFIRRELEFEFRSKLINLRQGFLETNSKKEDKIIVEKAVPTLMPMLNGLLFVKDIDVPHDLEKVFDLIEKEYKVSLNILKNLKNNELEDSIRKMIILLSKLGDILDEMKIE
ncbi:hypothetical protein CL617_03025 [archaeon]|nr:hypothetical protein [archaeon]|tara:strand:- start:14464 stop:15102 length:639 start_codon:yes stop_codon:yes gene_type:complete